MKLAVAAVALSAVLAHARAAQASAACAGQSGFAPHTDVVPAHAHILVYTDRALPKNATLMATLDGKPVPIKVTPLTPLTSGDLTMMLVEIDSVAAGTLVVGWKDAAWLGTASYRVDPKLAIPKAVHGSLSHFHSVIRHTSSVETWDGIAFDLDVPALELTIRWRLDAQTPFSTIELPVVIEDDRNAGLLGELGCRRNFTVPLLEQGLEVEVSATLADGTTTKVLDVPAHIALPK